MKVSNLVNIIQNIFGETNIFYEEQPLSEKDFDKDSGLLTINIEGNKYLEPLHLLIEDLKILQDRKNFVFKIVVEDEIENTFIRVFWNSHDLQSLKMLNQQILYVFGNTDEITERIHDNPIILLLDE